MKATTQSLSSEVRKALLRHARQTASWVLSGNRETHPAKPVVEGRYGGAFVTFCSGKALRGCVGTFAPTTDLGATIEHVTRLSLADRRFASDPITCEELPRLTIEVSVLTDPLPTPDPLSLRLGIHGIIVRRGSLMGCFLPKVATERGWSVEEFLSQCCTMKAGLAADAWRDPQTTVCLFSAEVFSEGDADLSD